MPNPKNIRNAEPVIDEEQGQGTYLLVIHNRFILGDSLIPSVDDPGYSPKRQDQSLHGDSNFFDGSEGNFVLHVPPPGQ